MHKIRNLDESMKTLMFVCACVVYVCIIGTKIREVSFYWETRKM